VGGAGSGVRGPLSFCLVFGVGLVVRGDRLAWVARIAACSRRGSRLALGVGRVDLTHSRCRSRGFCVEPLSDGLRGAIPGQASPAPRRASLGNRSPPRKIHAWALRCGLRLVGRSWRDGSAELWPMRRPLGSRHPPVPRPRQPPVPRRRHSPVPRRRHSPVPRRRHSPVPRRRHSPVPRHRHPPIPRRRHSPTPLHPAIMHETTFTH
jgi:hypothetical protein